MAETRTLPPAVGAAPPIALADESATRRRRTIWQRAGPSFWSGLALLVLVVGVAVAAPWLSPYDPIRQDVMATLQPPSPAHPFGTDNFGRDVFSRTLHGTIIDLQIGLISVIFPFLFGSLIGCVTGYFGGWLDTLVGRIVDVIMAFPFLILVIAIMAMLGPGLNNMYIAVAMVGWISYHRIVRSDTLVVRALEYVVAARTLGSRDVRIVLNHVLPNVITPAIVYAFTHVVTAILLGASLSFLGLGVAPPTPEWGAIIAESRPFMLIAWWIPTFPGLALVIAGLAFSLLGDGLADMLRPEIDR